MEYIRTKTGVISIEYKLSNGKSKRPSHGNKVIEISDEKLKELNRKWSSVKYTERNLQAMIDELGMLEIGEVEPYKRGREIDVDKMIDEVDKVEEQRMKKQEQEDKEAMKMIEDEFKELYSDEGYTLWVRSEYIPSIENDIWESVLFSITYSEEYRNRILGVKIGNETLQIGGFDVVSEKLGDLSKKIALDEGHRFLETKNNSFHILIKELIGTRRPTEENPIVLSIDGTNLNILVMYFDGNLFVGPYIT